MITREELEARLEPYWAERPVWKGLDIDDGWLGLINSLVTALETTGDPFPEIVQIKTKFGGLRFYVQGATELQRRMIMETEKRSTDLCEKCGRIAETVVIGGWWITLCEDHKAEEESRAKA